MASMEAKSKKKTLSTKSKKNKPKRNGGQSKANIRISKCWNAIMFIAEHEYFINNFLAIIEQTLLPLFEHIVEPSSIDFDDDIIFCICCLLKKSKGITETNMKIFPYLPQFQMKYKGIFGHLFLALNYYIVYGKNFIETSVGNMKIIFDMSIMSLFKSDQPIFLSNNAEGAILMALML